MNYLYSSISWLESEIPLIHSLSIILLYLGIIVIVAESLSRFFNKENAEFTRKIVHIGAGNVILLAWWLEVPAWIGIGAAAIASCIALISLVIPILPSVNSVGRKSLGTFFYAISIGVLIAWFWHLNKQEYAAIGVLIMTWGDGMAAIIGQRFGKHHYQVLGIKKSWEGSLAMAFFSFLVTFFILLAVQGNMWETWLIAIIVSVMATSLEAFSVFGIDNLTVPIASSALVFFCCQFLGTF